MSKNKPDRYRYDSAYGRLYEWDPDQQAYLFAAKANGRSKEETIRDYEESLNLDLFGDVPEQIADFDEDSLFID